MEHYFSASYWEARQAFRRSAQQVGAQLESILHPLAGPDGEPIATDVAVLGNPEASRVLLTTSGVHGVEGFFGSAVQRAVLCGELSLPANAKVVLVHAINPWGWSHGRRFTEDNVDLNRNFWAGAWSHPEHNKAYQQVQPWAELKGLQPSDYEQAQQYGEQLAQSIGAEQMKIALSAGQQCAPEGLFYVGHGHTWSRAVFERLCWQHLAQASQVFYFDLHTGLGPDGYADVLNQYPPKSEAYRQVVACLGDVAEGKARDGATGQTILNGTAAAVQQVSEQTGVHALCATVECGTQPLEQVLDALRREQAMHFLGNVQHPGYAETKQNLRAAFYVETPVWKKQVCEQTLGYLQSALDWLGVGQESGNK
ncbi:MAG: DUF2817 domain-containing protein [Thiolinea sp.]